eukprot:SAG11_NODE_2782_length_2978_cov_2.284126_3_plen_192_part_00
MPPPLRLRRVAAHIVDGAVVAAEDVPLDQQDVSAEILAGRLADCHDDLAYTLGYGMAAPAVEPQFGVDAPPTLLSDSQVQEFIERGVVVVTPSFGDGDQLHRDVIERLDCSRGADAPDAAGESNVEGGQVVGVLPPQWGSELSGVPELQCIFDHPTVRGALTSLVGEGYLLNPHHHIHLRLPGAADQGWHK